jgi:hypothetical protein
MGFKPKAEMEDVCLCVCVSVFVRAYVRAGVGCEEIPTPAVTGKGQPIQGE